MSEIEDAVMRKIYERALMGKNKYGVTMERDDLTLDEWLTHAQEEAMGLAVYLEKAKRYKRLKIVLEIHDEELGIYHQEITEGETIIQLRNTKNSNDTRAIVHLCDDVEEWYAKQKINK